MLKILIMLLFSPLNSYSFDSIISNKETVYKLPTGLLRAIIKVESDFNQHAVNNKAIIPSYGLGQLTQNTAKDSCSLGISEIYNVNKNLDCSAKILARHLKKYQDIELAIMSYNEGAPCFCINNYYRRKIRKRQVICTPVQKCLQENAVRKTEYLSKVIDVYSPYYDI